MRDAATSRLTDLLAEFSDLHCTLAGAVESAIVVERLAEKSVFVFDSVVDVWTDTEYSDRDRIFLAGRLSDGFPHSVQIMPRDDWRADTLRRLSDRGLSTEGKSDWDLVLAMREVGGFLDPHGPLRAKGPLRTLPKAVIEACDRLEILRDSARKLEEALKNLPGDACKLLDSFTAPRLWRTVVLEKLACLHTWPAGKFTPVHLITEDQFDFSRPERLIDFISRVLSKSPSPAWNAIFDSVSEWVVQCESLRLESLVVDADQTSTVMPTGGDKSRRRLQDCQLKAYAAWKIAESHHAPKKITYVEAYKWLKDNAEDVFVGQLAGYEYVIPDSAKTWASHASKGCAAHGESKHSSRAGRQGRSTVSVHDF